MSYLQTVPIDEATGVVRELYDEDVAEDGRVANQTELFSLRPDVYKAWGDLVGTIRGNMDLRRYELATLAAARALRCRACVGAHAAVLESKFYDRAALEAIMRDYHDAGLASVDVAIMELAEKIALYAYRVTPEDVSDLRGLGLTDVEIFDVALTSAARCFMSKTLDSMGMEPEPGYAETAQLLDLVALTEVRP